jgi:hypothetical protein
MTVQHFIKIAAVSTFALVTAGCVAVAAVPMLRHYLVALFNDPRDLPVLESDTRVHFEPEARACALDVAALLPAALARVEDAQERPFARGPTIGVYASYENYARANGLEDPAIAAVSRSGRVLLSPTLCRAERARLRGVLTHELSHVHLFGWRSSLFSARPPSWFTEGLAVAVSDGGGAEGVSEVEAAEALRKGYAIVVTDDGRWRDFASIRLEIEPPGDPSRDDFVTFRQSLAYREAAMFVAWLRERDPDAFAKLLRDIESGESFRDSFQASYAASSSKLWRDFVSRLVK